MQKNTRKLSRFELKRLVFSRHKEHMRRAESRGRDAARETALADDVFATIMLNGWSDDYKAWARGQA